MNQNQYNKIKTSLKHYDQLETRINLLKEHLEKSTKNTNYIITKKHVSTYSIEPTILSDTIDIPDLAPQISQLIKKNIIEEIIKLEKQQSDL